MFVCVDVVSLWSCGCLFVRWKWKNKTESERNERNERMIDVWRWSWQTCNLKLYIYVIVCVWCVCVWVGGCVSEWVRSESDYKWLIWIIGWFSRYSEASYNSISFFPYCCYSFHSKVPYFISDFLSFLSQIYNFYIKLLLCDVFYCPTTVCQQNNSKWLWKLLLCCFQCWSENSSNRLMIV